MGQYKGVIIKLEMRYISKAETIGVMLTVCKQLFYFLTGYFKLWEHTILVVTDCFSLQKLLFMLCFVGSQCVLAVLRKKDIIKLWFL